MTRALQWLLPRSERSERRRALVAFVALFGILFSFAVLRTAADAVFLGRIPVRELPWVYLSTAVLATGVAALLARGRRSHRAAGSLAGLLLGSAVVTGICALSVSPESRLAVYGLSVWTGVFGTLATFQLWLVVGMPLSVEQAKRIFGFVGAGAVSGALAGSSCAAALTWALPPRGVVFVAAAVMAGTAAFAAARFGAGPALATAGADHRMGPPATGAILKRRSYVRRLLALTLVAGVTLTFADFWFKHEVARFVHPRDLGPFLGITYATLHGIALVAQLGVIGAVLRRLGAPRALWIVPGTILFGTLGSWLGLGVVAACLLKAADESLRHTIDATAHEVLHVPIARDHRPTAKRILDVAGRRAAQALGSFAILGLGLLPHGHAWVPALLATGATIWIALAARLRPAYLALAPR